MPTAAYDEIADWYEQEYAGHYWHGDTIGVGRLLDDLLGPGADTCLEIGCGTGFHADRIRRLGWTPVGVDLSKSMLRHAKGRVPAARADAAQLPVADHSVTAVVSVLVHTDMPAYETVLREAHRVLRPGGVFVHIGVHPCFCGGFADRSDADAIVIRPGYLNNHWTKDSWTDRGIRDKIGAAHWPLPGLLNSVLDAGFRPVRFAEGGEPTPIVLGLRAFV